ncbi:MAG: AAA family ATPase [Sphaerochaeta sp.]|nr:AAA family ATPase [Sphaerochaeta sp.]
MEKYISELNIATYRGIKELSIENLGMVNVLLGDNNTGKTSVLEAIQILCNPCEYNLIRVARQRDKYRTSLRMGINTFESFRYLFDNSPQTENSNKLEFSISGILEGGKQVVSVTGEISTRLIDSKDPEMKYLLRQKTDQTLIENHIEIPEFIGEISATYTGDRQPELFPEKITKIGVSEVSRIFQGNKERPLVKVKSLQVMDHIIDNSFEEIIKRPQNKEQAVLLLREFDENITDIRYINNEGRFFPVVEKNNSEYLPLSMYGDGMKKALSMANAIMSCQSGVVLIDEFETALHTTSMSKVFKFIMTVSKKFNVQLFLTTHSLEAVDKLLNCSAEDIDSIRVIRLKKKGNKTLSSVITGSEALEERNNYNLELRV